MLVGNIVLFALTEHLIMVCISCSSVALWQLYVLRQGSQRSSPHVQWGESMFLGPTLFSLMVWTLTKSQSPWLLSWKGLSVWMIWDSFGCPSGDSPVSVRIWNFLFFVVLIFFSARTKSIQTLLMCCIRHYSNLNFIHVLCPLWFLKYFSEILCCLIRTCILMYSWGNNQTDVT